MCSSHPPFYFWTCFLSFYPNKCYPSFFIIFTLPFHIYEQYNSTYSRYACFWDKFPPFTLLLLFNNTPFILPTAYCSYLCVIE
jgi:hypothetical protein